MKESEKIQLWIDGAYVDASRMKPGSAERTRTFMLIADAKQMLACALVYEYSHPNKIYNAADFHRQNGGGQPKESNAT